MISGRCHCGDVQWTTPAWPEWVTICNCSYCRKAGAQWGEVDPNSTEMVSEIPQERYIFGDKTLIIHRCNTCGITTHWSTLDPEAPQRMKINFSTLNGDLPESIPIRHFDGADSWQYLD